MNKNKIMASLLAFVMMLSVFAPSFAYASETASAAPTAEQGTKKVMVHKILFSKEQFEKVKVGTEGQDKTKYTGQQLEISKFFGADSGAKEIEGVYFVWEVEEGNAWKYIEKDSEGPKIEGGKVKTTTEINNAFGKLTEKKQGSSYAEFDTSKLPAGKYRINEVHESSTYVSEDGKTLTDMKAVPVEITLPLENEKGVVEEVHVYPKNTEDKPTVDKKLGEGINKDTVEAKDLRNTEQAKAEIGKKVPYIVTTKIPAKSKYKTAFWSDKMTEGLTFDKDSIKVTIGPKVNKEAVTSNQGLNKYTLTTTENGFDLEFKDDWLKEINNQETEVTVTIEYTATVNSAAIVEVPEANDITFHYGNNPGHGNTPVPTKPNPGDKSIKVTKTWDNAAYSLDTPTEVEYTIYNAQTGEKVNVDGNPKKVTYQKGQQAPEIKWTNLDENTEYIVKEKFVKGYAANYSSDKVGEVTIDNKKNNNPEPIQPQTPRVIVYGKKFVKTNSEGTNDRLQGAQFLVLNSDKNKYLVTKNSDKDKKAYENAQKNYLAAIEAYNNRTPDKEKNTLLQKVEETKKLRDDAFIKAKTVYEWIDKSQKDVRKADLVTLISNENGQFEINGLEKGIKYYLEEVLAPEGYAKSTSLFEFEAGGGTKDISYEKEGKSGNDAQQVKNKKVTIPQTGGIGTIIFTVAGLAIMGGAFYAMKKRNEEQEEA